MYKLSKDYELMYDYLIKGNDIFCLVDYDFFRDNREPIRDVCRCRRFDEYSIDFGARGICYGDVRNFHKKEGTEKELFISQCKRMNLEWVEP